MRKRFINPPELSDPPGYTHVVAASGGTTVYVSGQIALDGDGNLVGAGDLRGQTEQVFQNIQVALGAAGATFADVIKLNFYILNYQPDDRLVIRDVRDRYVNVEQPPASTLVGVAALAVDGLLLEVEAVAVID